ncbi:hypothetical protein ACFFX1_37230 [Dactylosporangium sucinum]|uniref:Uncharacterized protein n=1 Tax=Dactylosporangium sucinum TaxID=1424081 RepID=A0A917UCR5_9ACTN|nr:hypothetical protein [Dactylosporangium sucinum]GGM81517.1 hypothetical protein GCM10007977_098650 [Dactylosporangium sucinum]
MKLQFNVDGEDVAILEIWEEKVPGVAAKIREALPFTSFLQHGKIAGDLLLIQTKIMAAWENVYYPEDFGPEWKATKGDVRGAVSFYGPRQQMSIVYGSDLASEPLPVSSIGEVIEGHDKLELIGTKAWLEPGAKVRVSLYEE